ncbi:reverse ribonuclease integrase [Lasius niger]|uniref:Reverse ribonuclease integrase n=1 Tax=Lasius niger TaxID=67767 RepID=A0A0J7NKJ8_LASNI|nr:reverse ribonuclease integrase [Lasius niger]
MKSYLKRYNFIVITDHQSLHKLQELEAPTRRLAHWIFELQQYDFEVKYRQGTLNRVADALSQQPEICAAQTGANDTADCTKKSTVTPPPDPTTESTTAIYTDTFCIV